MAENYEVFSCELSYIKYDNLRNYAIEMLRQLPEYFYHVAASSTGKYHPSYCLGEGGLVRHTKAAVRVAKELMRLEMYQSIAQYSDYIIIALLLHDGLKHGLVNEDGTYSQYSKWEHPVIVANFILQIGTNLLSKDELQFISNLTLTHMGQWTFNEHTGQVPMPKPWTQEQCFVHLCDYLASRKCMEVNLGELFNE
jgi:hypothetical protein